MNFSKDNIYKRYNQFILRATKYYNRKNLNKCLAFLKAASETAYFFNLGFKDDIIEEYLKKISHYFEKDISNIDFLNNNCVFFDSFCLDNKGLTQQYVRSIIYAGWNLMYIYESNEIGHDILNDINQYEKSTIIHVPSFINGTEKSKFIYDTIIEFRPTKLFMHISPSAVYAVTAFYALPKQIEKYQINLTDYTFWIGAGCLDYSLEYQFYGASLSIYQRKIPKNNVFIIPFYSIVTNTLFMDLPYQCKDKIVIIAGGAYYKIIDEKDTFFKLMKIVLEISEDVVIIYAGDGDSILFRKFIQNNNYENRLLLIGYRKDINEVIKNSDIYLNTYPYSGGLLCHYAAQNSKPILSFSSKGLTQVEEMICQRKKIDISLFDFKSFRAEAENLIFDKDYRVKKGKELKNCIIEESYFNKLFVKTIAEKKNQFEFFNEEKIKDNNFDAKIKYENQTNHLAISIVSIIGLRTAILYPKLFFSVIKTLIRNRSVGFYVKKYISKIIVNQFENKNRNKI